MKMVLIAVAFVVAGEDGSSDLDRWITRRRQLRSECADDTESVAPMYGGYQKSPQDHIRQSVYRIQESSSYWLKH